MLPLLQEKHPARSRHIALVTYSSGLVELRGLPPAFRSASQSTETQITWRSSTGKLLSTGSDAFENRYLLFLDGEGFLAGLTAGLSEGKKHSKVSPRINLTSLGLKASGSK